MQFKRKLIQYSVPLSLVIGAISFLLMYFRLHSMDWKQLPAIGAAVVVFLVCTAACYLILNNIVDPYKLEVVTAKQKLSGILESIEDSARRIYDSDVKILVRSIVKNVGELVKRTEEKTPNSMLSTVKALINWMNTAYDCLDQFADIERHPEYQDSPQERLTKGKEALLGLEMCLINSIKLLESGDNIDFDVAARMLEASKFNLIS